MVNTIHNLVLLLEAESLEVRQAVTSELKGRSQELRAWFNENHPRLSPETQFLLFDLVKSHQEDVLCDKWLEWLDCDNQIDRLEGALSILARLDPSTRDQPSIACLLDDLAAVARKENPAIDIFMLNRFLFVEGRFSGSRRDYLNPSGSNMVHVLTRGEGLPLSLTLVFMLTGHRLGLEILGFNRPGHFLARADVDDRPYLFDCYDNGRILTNQDIYISTLTTGFDIFTLLNYPPTAVDMISRVLCNLVNSYYRDGDLENSRLCGRLLAELRKADPQRLHLENRRQGGGPLFSQGELVRHKRYHYRGVVVDYDSVCQAEDEWYYGNQTQPRRDQPWYYVLVAGSDHNTYVAQNNLERDLTAAEVEHPLIATYFTRFLNGKYIRNRIPWQLPL